MVSIHGPLGYEPNTLTTAPLRCCKDDKSRYVMTLPVANALHSKRAGPSIAEGECELQSYGDSCAITGPCGLMDKALVFGTKDCRFESCQGHACWPHAVDAAATGPGRALCFGPFHSAFAILFFSGGPWRALTPSTSRLLPDHICARCLPKHACQTTHRQGGGIGCFKAAPGGQRGSASTFPDCFGFIAMARCKA